MTWCAIDVTSRPADRDAIATWLVSHTGMAVEERADGTLVSFAPDAVQAAQLTQILRHAFPSGLITAMRPLASIDWSTQWRQGIGVRHFGRLSLAPSWLSHGAAVGEVSIVLDPESAFGSGEHGSTRAALTLLERILVPGERVLDLGSGSGVLAIAAAKLGALRATGIEIDAEANPIAERNAVRNGVGDRVEFVEGDAAHLAPLLGPVDVVVSNILRMVNQLLLPTIHRTLRPGGHAIFSGMEEPEAPLFLAELAEAGFVVVDQRVDDLWWAVLTRRA